MDPVTIAIIAAISAGVASGGGKVAEQALVDAYEGLKGLLKKKFGEPSKVVTSVAELEENPESDARKGVLREEIKKVKADEDEEICKVAKELENLLEKNLEGKEHIKAAQIAIGRYIAIADNESTALAGHIVTTHLK